MLQLFPLPKYDQVASYKLRELLKCEFIRSLTRSNLYSLYLSTPVQTSSSLGCSAIVCVAFRLRIGMIWRIWIHLRNLKSYFIAEFIMSCQRYRIVVTEPQFLHVDPIQHWISGAAQILEEYPFYFLSVILPGSDAVCDLS